MLTAANGSSIVWTLWLHRAEVQLAPVTSWLAQWFLIHPKGLDTSGHS